MYFYFYFYFEGKDGSAYIKKNKLNQLEVQK